MNCDSCVCPVACYSLLHIVGSVTALNATDLSNFDITLTELTRLRCSLNQILKI